MAHDLMRRMSHVLASRRRDGEGNEHVQVKIGIDLATGKLGLEFTQPIKEIRMEPARARRLAQMILKVCDDIEGRRQQEEQRNG